MKFKIKIKLFMKGYGKKSVISSGRKAYTLILFQQSTTNKTLPKSVQKFGARDIGLPSMTSLI